MILITFCYNSSYYKRFLYFWRPIIRSFFNHTKETGSNQKIICVALLEYLI